MARANPPSDRSSAASQEPAPAAELRTQRLEALHRQLTDGVAAIRDGASWQAWLDVASKFHRYSFGNQILLASQNPQATLVAGYRTWQRMGRQVRKGEQALWVLAPVTTRRRNAGPSTDIEHQPDSDSGTPAEPEGHSGADWSRGRVVGFRGAPVFDVTQTEGDPLPTPPRAELLAGQAPAGLWDGLAAAITTRGFTVTRCPTADEIGGANGITDYTTRTVTVRADVEDAQAVKTLAHEAGHVLLHDLGAASTLGPGCRDLLEVEAESVAYLVAAHHGLGTAGYTFAYIAAWAGRDDTAVAATATRVLGAARTLIDATDPASADQVTGAAELAATSRAAVTTTAETAARAEAFGDRQTVASATAESQLEALRAVTRAAQIWFCAQATTSPAYAAAVTARGHTVDSALRFGVGYAPLSWTGLVDHLRGLGHPAENLLAAGVATTTRGGRLIDRFRGRVTFPVHDSLGVVGFTARDITGTGGAPKYLNSPAGPLYDKARLLYGVQHLSDQTTTVVLVEGPWDALAVTMSAGGDTIGLAACGTAVTEHHLDLATRGGWALVLGPDPDAAGQASLGRSLTLLASLGQAHPGAVTTPPGTDLADLHAGAGAPAVRQVLAAARSAGIVYAEQHLTAHPPTDTPEARVAAARAAAAHKAGLTVAQRADLASVLIRHAGVGLEAALAILAPGAAAQPRSQHALPAPAGVPASNRSGPRV